jgi:hypothetical protein
MTKNLISAGSITPFERSAISFIVRAPKKDQPYLLKEYIEPCEEISDSVKASIRNSVMNTNS